MPEVQSQSLPSDEVLRQLQETLLKAILLKERLPGGNQPIMFPDLSFILGQPTIVLVDENLAGPVTIEQPPKPIRIMSREDLLLEARTKGDIAYLLFRPPQGEDKSVKLTLEAKIAPCDPTQLTLGLSGVQVKFQKVTGQWEAIEEPAFFAT